MKTPESATDNNVGSKMFENVLETNVGKINGRAPDGIKKGLEYCGNNPYCDGDCEYYESTGSYGCQLSNDALAYIQQLESTYSQVSKALCGKENATLEELLLEVDQLKSRLAQVERERDAAVAEIKRMEAKAEELRNMVNDVIHRGFTYSDYLDFINQVDQICNYQFENEWRGGFEKNMKESSE